MSAQSQHERLLFRAGAMPSAILSHEPNIDAPVPTRVELTGTHGEHDIYRAELDGEGRLVAVTLEDLNPRSYMVRRWTGTDTYEDHFGDGPGQSIAPTDMPHKRLLTRPDGSQATLVRSVELEGDTAVDLEVHDNPRNPALGDRRPFVYVTQRGMDGRLIDEEEWSHFDYYSDPLGPEYTRYWEYDHEGNLIAIVKRAGENGYVAFTEEYTRDGNHLNVQGIYPDDMVGYEQDREYDSSGRVEVIRDRIYVPTSAMHDVTLELSYDG